MVIKKKNEAALTGFNRKIICVGTTNGANELFRHLAIGTLRAPISTKVVYIFPVCDGRYCRYRNYWVQLEIPSPSLSGSRAVMKFRPHITVLRDELERGSLATPTMDKKSQ
jgi:hypothetical protein